MDEIAPFPLLAIVGQAELKTALVLSLINPRIGGVLLIGPYGVGKTTAVRGLLDVLLRIPYADEDDEGNPQTTEHQMRLIELPLNARIEDVVGGVNERVAMEQQRILLEEGILAKAHRNLLYVDEINLLDPRVVDAILDAAAQGRTLVRRGPMIRLFPSQFILIGSMNPEEGTLRPQILDRFGLRVWVAPLDDAQQRLEVYRRTQQFRADPLAFRNAYANQTAALYDDILVAREILPHVTVPPEVEQLVLSLIQQLQIPSHRAEITLLEAVRTRAAADFRNTVIAEDVERMATLALRQRHSPAIESYAARLREEDDQVRQRLGALRGTLQPPQPPPDAAPRSGKKRSTMRSLEENS